MTTIKYIDHDEYVNTKNRAMQAVHLLSNTVHTQKQELFVSKKEVELLQKRLEAEKNKKQLQNFEKVGGNDDFGELLASELQRAMAPLTAEMERELIKKSKLLSEDYI